MWEYDIASSIDDTGGERQYGENLMCDLLLAQVLLT